MIVVNNLSAWTDTPRLPRLRHAECTAVPWPTSSSPYSSSSSADLGYFPATAAKARRQPIRVVPAYPQPRRGALLPGPGLGSGFIIGWLCQALCPPEVTRQSLWATFLSPPANSEAFYFSLANLRIMGVLQRIALVYLAVSLLLITPAGASRP